MPYAIRVIFADKCLCNQAAGSHTASKKSYDTRGKVYVGTEKKEDKIWQAKESELS